MTFDLKRMMKSKSELRHKLAKRPLAEKLGMLDELRERARVIRQAAESLPQDIRRKAQAKRPSDRVGEKRPKR